MPRFYIFLLSMEIYLTISFLLVTFPLIMALTIYTPAGTFNSTEVTFDSDATILPEMP